MPIAVASTSRTRRKRWIAAECIRSPQYHARLTSLVRLTNNLSNCRGGDSHDQRSSSSSTKATADGIRSLLAGAAGNARAPQRRRGVADRARGLSRTRACLRSFTRGTASRPTRGTASPPAMRTVFRRTDAWTPDGFTPLHLAALVDNVDAAETLLALGADPNALATASFARVTPLGTCAFSGALGVARVLLEHGADPHIGEDGVYTVDAEAVARGNDELASSAPVEGVHAMSAIQEFVGNAHGDLDAVRTALAADPTLANAAWDWGGGDWECATRRSRPHGPPRHRGASPCPRRAARRLCRGDARRCRDRPRNPRCASRDEGCSRDRTGSRFAPTQKQAATTRGQYSSFSTRSVRKRTELRRAKSARSRASRRSRARRLPSRR